MDVHGRQDAGVSQPEAWPHGTATSTIAEPWSSPTTMRNPQVDSADRQARTTTRLRHICDLAARRWHIHRCAQVLDDLLGKPLRRQARSRNALQGKCRSGIFRWPIPSKTAARPNERLVGAAKRADRTANAIVRIGCIPLHQRKIGPQGRQQSCDQLRTLHDCCRRATKTVQNGKQFVVRPQASGEDRRKRRWASAAGNEQMHGGPAIDRAQLPGRFIGHQAPTLWPKKAERHRHQRLERMVQPLHERAHGGEGRLVEARGAARQLHRTEIDLGRHEAPHGQVERGISRSVRKGKKAAANGRASIRNGTHLSSVIASIVLGQPLDQTCRTRDHAQDRAISKLPSPAIELQRPAAHGTAFRASECHA